MRAGKLDRQVEIQTFTASRDSFGAEIPSWSTLATVWAERIPLKGMEYFAAAQVVAEEQVKYRIRYRSDLTEKVRIIDAGQTYDVQHIAEIGRREGLELVCKRP